MLSLECPAIVCFCFAFALFFALLLHLLRARDSNQGAAGEMAGHNLELRCRQPTKKNPETSGCNSGKKCLAAAAEKKKGRKTKPNFQEPSPLRKLRARKQTKQRSGAPVPTADKENFKKEPPQLAVYDSFLSIFLTFWGNSPRIHEVFYNIGSDCTYKYMYIYTYIYIYIYAY